MSELTGDQFLIQVREKLAKSDDGVVGYISDYKYAITGPITVTVSFVSQKALDALCSLHEDNVDARKAGKQDAAKEKLAHYNDILLQFPKQSFDVENKDAREFHWHSFITPKDVEHIGEEYRSAPDPNQKSMDNPS